MNRIYVYIILLISIIYLFKKHYISQKSIILKDYMSATISSIHYCPVKSVSFQSIKNCEIKKNTSKKEIVINWGNVGGNFYTKVIPYSNEDYAEEFINELIKNKELSDQISQEIKIVEDNLSKIENKRENQRNEITRLEGVVNNLKAKEKELRSLIFQRSSKQPEEIENESEFSELKSKTHEEIKEKLERLGYQREQMGPVNLRAKIEESE